ncbi:MAG: ABC transporter permease [Anaerolineae bacterium]|nr:ABC transporter permease [Anaerolineae bacterium]MDW8103141.1 ABC transporter permease [Anaerolineae bacterium]
MKVEIGVPAQTSLFRDALRRLFRNKLAIIGMVLLGIFVFCAIFAPWIAPYDPLAQDITRRREPPSWKHPFGIDEVGRDLLSRVIYGARVSLSVGVASVSLAIIVGTLIGAASGYAGGWVDNIVMRVMDIMLAFPSLLLAIAIVAILGPGLLNMLYAIAFVSIPVYARIVRASVLAAKETDYVLAARAIGCSSSRILFRHIMPNCLTPIIVQGTLGIATAILDAAGLSFLGLGAQPPTPEWGAMLGQGRGSVFTAPHVVIFPGLAIMLTVLGFNLLGDGLRDALDPRLRV